MKKFDGYKAGVNLGGWISQFRQAKKEHFDSFITEEDIKQIASWGMDHVRLPLIIWYWRMMINPLNIRKKVFLYRPMY